MQSEWGLYTVENDTAHWYAIHTISKQEDRAHYNLLDMGVESFAPKIKQRSYNRRPNAPCYIAKSLFPGYLFARFVPEMWLHKVRYTRGVHSVVNADGKPIAIEHEIIDAIQARVASDGFVKLNDELQPGEKIVITAGVFKGLAGVFERKLKDTERVVILLNTIGYQANLTLDSDQVKRESIITGSSLRTRRT
jgi:transcription elongation factor/antiterminator RfaH